MRFHRLLIAVAVSAPLLAVSYAEAAPFGLGIEPIIGYERVQKVLPTQHTKDRLIYGARLTLGIPLLSAEAEFTRGTDTENFPSDDLTIKDTDDKLKLGLRS